MVTPDFVQSSNINCLGHDGNTLFIRFNNGESYAYSEAPSALLDTLKGAESVGQAFHRYVKGKYRYRKLDRDPFEKVSVALVPAQT